MPSDESIEVESPVDDLARRVELQDIFFESFSAALIRLAEPAGLQLNVTSSCARQPKAILFRYVVAGNLLGEPQTVSPTDQSPPGELSAAGDSHGGRENGEVLAELKLIVVCHFSTQVDNDADLIDDGLLDEFSETIGYRLAFPYIRETISSMASKLGFPATTFGLLRPGTALPSLFGRRLAGPVQENS